MMRWIKTSSRTVLFFLHCGFIPMGFPGKVLTRQQLVGAQETKANCSSSTTTWITFPSQLENTSKWNQPSIRSHEGDIQFTSHVDPNLTCLDLRALFGGLRSNHKELSYKPTWYVFLIQQRSPGNWIRTKPRSDEKVIQFLNQPSPDLPYSELSNFGSLQTYVWQPGELLHQLESPKKVFTFINDHWIRWIQSYSPTHKDLPYMDPRAFKAQPQQLYFLKLGHDLKLYYINQNVPRHFTFGPKLSRLKHNPHFLILADSLFIAPTAISFDFCDLFLFL